MILSESGEYYLELPVFVQIDIKHNWPSYEGTENLLKASDKEKKYYFHLQWMEGAFFPKYDILSENPPPIKLKIKPDSDKREYQYNFEMSAFSNHLQGDLSGIKYTGLKSGEVHSMLIDIRPYFSMLKSGTCSVQISFSYTDGIEKTWDNQFKIKLKELDDSTKNYLNTTIPEYMLENGTLQTLNTYEQDLWKKKEFIFAANDRMKLIQLKEKLPDEVYSQLALLFYLTYIRNHSEINEANSILDMFPKLLNPISICFKYEMAILNHNKISQDIKDRILKEFPGQKWRISDIEKGKGLITKKKNNK